MTTIRKIAWTCAIGLILVGSVGQWGAEVSWDVPGIDWLWQSKVEAAVIVEETADRPKLTEAQIHAIMEAPALKISVVDKDVVDRDKKPPAALVPYLDAAKDKPLPVLVTKRGSKFTAVPLVDTDKLKADLQ